MLPDTTTGLSEEQINQLNQARLLIPKVKEQIRRAEQAGIDVKQHQADLAALETQIDKLHKVYVSKRPTTTGPY